MWGSCFWFCIRPPPARLLLPPPPLTCSHTTCTHTHNLHTTYSQTSYSHTTCSRRRGVLRGRRGTLWHRPSLCVAGVALDDIDCYFAWQARHLWHWVGSGGALGQPWRRDAVAFCVAGVALRDMCLHFVWQAWHLTTSIVTLRGRHGTYGTGLALAARLVSHGTVTPWRFAWQAWHFVTSAFTLCGRRGTWRHRLLLCVAGMALMALGWLWRRAWSAMAPWRRGVLRGRRGTLWHRPSLCVAGVALCDIYVRSTVTLCGRRGTYGTGLALAARLVSHGAVTPRPFSWQAWHFETSTYIDCYRTLCGRPGTYGTGLALAARLVSHGAVTPWRFAWQAWHFVTSAFTLCGRRGTLWNLRSINRHFVWQAWHLMIDMDCYFAWQAWHLWHWVGSQYMPTYIHTYIHTYQPQGVQKDFAKFVGAV